MNSTNLVPHRALLKAGVATALMAAATPALAQEQTAQLTETIIVTGSRIARPELQASSPVAVVGAEEFQFSGSMHVEEVLHELPQVIPSLSGASNNPGDGVATVDLRGLGAVRTLVLVNGRRYVAYDEQQVVDINTVPTALVERVDVVTGGRSAVYGSDAIAGVVNFVLKKDFEGVEVGGTYRLTEKGDADTYTINGIVGGNFADGKGNATVYVQYSKRSALFQADRAFSRNALVDDGDGGFFFGGSASIEPGRVVLPGMTSRMFDQSGNLMPYNPATDQYNFAPVNYLQTPNERWFIGGMANYEINEHAKVYTEFQYINSRAHTQLAPTPVSQNVALDVDSPFFSAATQAVLRGLDTDGDGFVNATFAKRFSEAGARFQLDDRHAYRAVVGMEGNITGTWSYDAYYSYARNRNIQTQEGNVAFSRWRNALRTTFDANGNLICADASARAAGCVPLNVFGRDKASDDAVAYVTVPSTNLNSIQSQVASVTVSNGSLFDMGAGPVGIALGAEWRSERGAYRPDFMLSSGDVVGFNAGEPTVGGYSVRELYGEVAVPLLADLPFAKKLEFNGAARYADYSNEVGSAWSYSAGLMWAPIEDITLRGQYQRAVRAPTVSQLFLGGSIGFPGATDPCEQPAALSNATLNATCRAQGVPANLIGTTFAGGNSQIQSRFGGNPNLTEETADTYTFGAVIQPSFLPRFTLTVDYYDITIKDFIGGAGPGTANIIAACYGNGDSNFTPYDPTMCALAPRNPISHELEDVVSENANLGKLKTSGIDFEARYWVNVPFGVENDGRLDFRWAATRLIEWKLNPIATVPELVTDCAGKFGNSCGDPFSKWRWSVRTTYSTGPLAVSLSWQHLSGAKDDDDGTVYWAEKMGGYDTFDLSASYDLNENLSFTAGVNNLFDKKPPLSADNSQQANTYPSTYDPYGRRYFFSAKAKF